MIRIVATVTTVALIVALAPLPYTYYMLLRVLVCASGIFCGIFLVEKEKKLAVALFICAAIFNPFIPAHLSRDIWAVLNVVGAGLFAFTAYRLSLI